MKSKALFLDRDGVVNVDYGYVHRAEDCVFVDGIFDLVRAANEARHVVAIVTNQAGIARGYYREDQFHALMRWMMIEFTRRGAHLDVIYFCPHHPEAGIDAWRMSCGCRKPAPGMLERARMEFDLDMQASIMVGDKESDMEAGRRAGVGNRFLLTQEALRVNGARSIGSLSEVLQALDPGPITARRQDPTRRSA